MAALKAESVLVEFRLKKKGKESNRLLLRSGFVVLFLLFLLHHACGTKTVVVCQSAVMSRVEEFLVDANLMTIGVRRQALVHLREVAEDGSKGAAN